MLVKLKLSLNQYCCENFIIIQEKDTRDNYTLKLLLELYKTSVTAILLLMTSFVGHNKRVIHSNIKRLATSENHVW